MHAATRLILVAMPLALAAPAAAAQEFRPPSGGGVSSSTGGLAVDLYSFSIRSGVDLSRRVRWVIGTTLDVAELWSPRVRFRPSVEISSDTASTTVSFHWAGEITYRFQPDNAPAIPYVGIGIGHMTSCRSCTTVWPTIALGFELQFRPSFNWLLEYHALDRLGRHRFLVGLATRNAAGGP